MKKRNLFMSLTLMCGFLCIAFTFDNKGVYWLWTENRLVVIILAISTIILGAFWFKLSKKLKLESKK